MAPIAADGKVFVGNAGGDRAGVTGHVYAFDAETGEMLWRFEVVPDTPEVRATWQMPPGNPLSGGGVWVSLSYDEETGVVYAQRPEFAVGFRYIDPSDRFRSVCLLSERQRQFL
jgi:alcohol dehydrogenase (cytochrome c)